MPQNNYFIGLMSGTSADGVDAALINSTQQQIQLIDFISIPLSPDLKKVLIKLNLKPNIELKQLCELEKDVADAFSETTQELLLKNKINASDVTAIGSHGQTIFHAPEVPMSLQIGHPAFIAKSTGITTVADFRVDDMAVGGQGAPFAPAFHQAMFTEDQPCFVVNIGGIANISFLPGNISNAKVLGWDTGPGNALMDEVCQRELNVSFDPSGENARTGQVHTELLKILLDHPYFFQTYPKSTGRDTFHYQWIEQTIKENNLTLSNIDMLATLCELTAKTIAKQIHTIQIPTDAHSQEIIPKIWIVGGGAYNLFLLERLQSHLPRYKVLSSEQVEINPNAVEAMMCGWLAKQRIENRTVALSAVTGATRDAVLGGIWHS